MGQLRLLTFTGLLLAASFPLSAQSTFEVASIKASLNSLKRDDAGHAEAAPGSVSMIGVTLLSCVRWAYGVRDDQVSGPAWLGTARYDIVAKAAGPTPIPELRVMMQALLADRFGMALHHESRTREVLVIGVGENGPKFPPAAETGPAKLKVVDGNLLFAHFTPAELADRLSVALGRPVLDRTGIAEAFDMLVPVSGGVDELKIAAERADLANEAKDPSPYVAALRKVGLKLETRKIPVDVSLTARRECPRRIRQPSLPSVNSWSNSSGGHRKSKFNLDYLTDSV